MRGWILGVQKLTESLGALLWFEGAFVKLEPPEGIGGGGEGEGEREGGRGGGGHRVWDTALASRSSPLFPQCQSYRCVNDNACVCLRERETHVQSMSHCIVIIYCGDKAGAQR